MPDDGFPLLRGDFSRVGQVDFMVEALLRRQVLFGLAAPVLMLACAALILLSCLSGSAALSASIASVAAAAALGAWAGTMIRRRRKKK